MKYRIEVSEEQLRVIGLAVDEYMRLRMGQFDAFAEELALDGVADRIEAYKDDYQRGILNERGYSIERMFEAAYKMAYPPHGCRGRQFMGNVYRHCTRHRAPAVVGFPGGKARIPRDDKSLLQAYPAGA